MTDNPRQSGAHQDGPQLVSAERLLEILFDEQSRPSLRWLRKMQAQRVIPYYKLGRLVRFDVEEVRSALAQNWKVQARHWKR